MVPQPHFDGLPVVGVAVRSDDRVSHELPGDGTGELIPQGGPANLLPQVVQQYGFKCSHVNKSNQIDRKDYCTLMEERGTYVLSASPPQNQYGLYQQDVCCRERIFSIAE